MEHAAAYAARIVDRGNAPFTKEWMNETFELFWSGHSPDNTAEFDYARAGQASALLSDTLDRLCDADAPSHLVEVAAATTYPQVANWFIRGLDTPATTPAGSPTPTPPAPTSPRPARTPPDPESPIPVRTRPLPTPFYLGDIAMTAEPHSDPSQNPFPRTADTGEPAAHQRGLGGSRSLSAVVRPRLWSRDNMALLYDLLIIHGTYWALWGPWDSPPLTGEGSCQQRGGDERDAVGEVQRGIAEPDTPGLRPQLHVNALFTVAWATPAHRIRARASPRPTLASRCASNVPTLPPLVTRPSIPNGAGNVQVYW